MTEKKERIAIIGGGISGIVTAFLLQQKFDVTIFEKNNYLGGHTNTITIPSGPDQGVLIDTGFIVLNDKTYPNFHKFLELLEVPWRYSDMSFGFFSERSGLQYAGNNLNSLFAQRTNLLNYKFISLLMEIKRFSKCAISDLQIGLLGDLTVSKYIEQNRYKEFFVRSYLIPMAAAIWSAPAKDILDFPVESLLQFFKNHGLLSFYDRPQWQTVVGGSKAYVDAFQKRFHGTIKLNTPIISISRKNSVDHSDGPGVEIVTTDNQSFTFDYAIIAIHSDEVLKLLSNPTSEEKSLFTPWSYQKNHTILHTDSSLLPPNKLAWASWNFREELSSTPKTPVSVTYHMNRLQGLNTKQEYCVTLNTSHLINQSKIIYETTYTHPVFDIASVKTQKGLNKLPINSGIGFAGSYFGYGFHEDGVNSAVRIGKLLGCEL